MDIKQTDNGRIIDYMARDYESLLASMRQMIPDLLPEWTDYEKETDFGNVLLQLFAHMGDIVGYYQDRLVNESFLTTARERSSIINHLQLIGYRLATATPASSELTLEFAADVTDIVRVAKGNAFSTKSTEESASVRFEYNGSPIDIDCNTLAVDSETNKKYYAIQVEQGRLIESDVLGVSNGSASQRFLLSYTELILRSMGSSNEVNLDIKVWTELGGVIDEEWAMQESLAFSREDAKDYTIEIDENDQATIVFGGNGFGAVVPSGSTIYAEYRIGGGTLGNVAAEKINTITDAPALNLVGAKVFNATAATGGADRETIENAVAHAPEVFRSLKRAVTAADYEALALNFNGVGKVRAKVENWNRVTLYIAPEGGGKVSDILTANLLAYFEDKRPLSTLIDIADVDYVKIYVSAKVGVESYYSKTEMQSKIETAVADLLAFENVDFGHVVYLSKFYEAIEALEGVTYVTVEEFYREGDAGPNDDFGKIQLSANEVPRIPGSDVEDSDDDMDYAAGLKVVEIEGGY